MVALPIAAIGQQASKLTAHVDLNASTIEAPDRTHATFTARVAPDESTGASPTGSVSFMNGEQSIGAAFLDAEGRASFTADALPTGMQKITAVYMGDDSFQAATSAPSVVNATTSGVPSFSLSAGATSLKVVAGGAASTLITATPANGFSQAVSLSCSGVPYVSVACVFSPAQITPGAATSAAPNGTPVVSTLTIQTTAASGALRDISGSNQTTLAVAVPGILALLGLGLARKRAGLGAAAGTVRMIALLCLLVAGGMGLGACSERYGYFHKPPEGNPGTPVGTYTVIVSGITGTGSSLTTATVPFTLTVSSK